MKQLILFICIAAFVISCTKKTGALETPIPKEDVNIIIQETGEQNVYRFINARIGQTATARWDLGNGQTANGDTVIGKYPFKGNYTVSLTIFNGVTAVQKTTLLSLNKDNVNLDSVYICLTGGPDSLNGKTWVMDTTRKNSDGSADFPVKIINGSTTTPKDYTNTGLYNSSWVFWLQGSKMTYKNNGYSLCHSSRIAEINSIWGAFTQTGTVGGDPYGTYTPKLAPQQTWTMSIKNGLHYIQMQGGAFIMFYRGCADVIEYQVSVINKNEMVLTHYETSPSGRAGWSDKYYLVRKGYVR